MREEKKGRDSAQRYKNQGVILKGGKHKEGRKFASFGSLKIEIELFDLYNECNIK